MFFGTYEHALDEKNRLMVPARLREGVPAEEGGVFYLTQGLDQCLYAYTTKGFNDLVAKFQAAKGNPSTRKFLRLFFSRAMRQELDAAGRVLIPDSHKEIAGIRRDVALVGVMDHIEIWDLQKWKRAEREGRPKFERFAEDAEIFG